MLPQAENTPTYEETVVAKQQLLSHLFSTNSIQLSPEGFVTKSGKKYYFETDVRAGITESNSAQEFAQLVYSLIERFLNEKTLLIGVPESGTLLSMLLYAERLRHGQSGFPINLMRAIAKGYQPETAHTVLPIATAQEVVVLEDDVVTGSTLLGYLQVLQQIGLTKVTVVSIIDRNELTDGKSVGDRVRELGFAYQYLIGLDDILGYAKTQGIIFPATESFK